MREEQKTYIRGLYQEIKKAEEQMRDRPMPALTKEDFFLFHETGNRLVYENAYFGRRKYLTVYAILALWSGELSRSGIIDEEAGDRMTCLRQRPRRRCRRSRCGCMTGFRVRRWPAWRGK